MPTPLTSLAEHIWEINQPFAMSGVQIGTRSTLIRLSDGDLWLHSPGPEIEALQTQIAELGVVRHIIAPNAFHHLFLPVAARLFPEATLWGPGAVQKKQPDLKLERLNDAGPSPWGPAIERIALNGTQFQEYAFFHPSSRSLIVTDLLFNMHPHDWRTRLLTSLTGTNGKVACSRILRKVLLQDKAALRASVDRVLGWDFQRILMAHGHVIDQDARDKFLKAMGWLF